MVALCLSLIAVSFVVSLPLTWALIGIGRRVGQVDAPDAPGSGGRKTHGRVVPNTGGVAIFVAIALPMLLALVGVHTIGESAIPESLAALKPHLAGLRRTAPMGAGVLAALLVIHVLGIIDDRKRLGPYSKLLVQLAVAAGLAIFCDARVFHFLDAHGPAGAAASVVVSVLWIVVVMNAMNFLDNMDGLSGGVGAICAGLYLAATLIGGQWFVAAMAAMLVGALLGFLVFNVAPAKVFMGDGGSLVIGLMLAIISVRTTYFETADTAQAVAGVLHRPGGWYGVLMPVMVLAVPLYDFTSVTLIRLAQGKSPFHGDQNHFSHRLVRKGLTKRTAVLVVWLCTLATGVSGVMLGSLEGWQAALAATQTLAVIAVLAVLERTRPEGA